MILHAEHEMNASTFAARVVAGTNADMHSAIVAAICALKGPLHGGANVAAMAMLAEFGSAAAVGRRHSCAAGGEAAALRLRPPALSRDGPACSDPAPAGGVVRGRRRAQLPRPRRDGRARGARAEGSLAQRRPLLGRALPLSGHPDRSLHPALRDEPRRRPGGACARAACGRENHPAERRIRRRAATGLPRPPAPLRYLPPR